MGLWKGMGGGSLISQCYHIFLTAQVRALAFITQNKTHIKWPATSENLGKTANLQVFIYKLFLQKVFGMYKGYK